VPRPPFSKTLREFQSKFATEEACQEYLAACRWPDGFVCPKCGNRRAYELANLKRWECAGCRYQVSLTAGTILHNTKTPLTVWFWAAYLMTTDKRGLSALLLQRQLGIGRYETAWMMLHKLRRAMVARERSPGLALRTAFLGHAPPSLPQVLSTIEADRDVTVLPLLLTAAYHSEADIPRMLARTPRPRVSYGATLGPHPLLLDALDRRLAEADPGAHADPGGTAVVLAARAFQTWSWPDLAACSMALGLALAAGVAYCNATASAQLAVALFRCFPPFPQQRPEPPPCPLVKITEHRACLAEAVVAEPSPQIPVQLLHDQLQLVTPLP